MKILNVEMTKQIKVMGILTFIGLVMIAFSFQSQLLANPSANVNGPGTKHDINAGYSHPDTCKSGYVWRESDPSDHVCVTPETRRQTRIDNNLASYRIQPGSGPYGGLTCKNGFVWREAVAGDRVCVTPQTRAQARYDNSQATARRLYNY